MPKEVKDYRFTAPTLEKLKEELANLEAHLQNPDVELTSFQSIVYIGTLASKETPRLREE